SGWGGGGWGGVGGGRGGGGDYSWSDSGQDFGFDFDLGDLGELFGQAVGRRGPAESIFERFFARQAGRTRRRQADQAAQPGADVQQEVSLSFEQAIAGTTLHLRLDVGGRTETITVKIPPGVADGQRIRLRGKGQPGVGGRPPGDLYILCRVQPHRYFRRQGNDIYIDLPISITEAALGAKVTLPSLDGRATVTVPAGTASGTKLRLRGKGVADPKTGQRGDQYAVVKIVPPRELDARSRQLLRELERLTNQNPRQGLDW
ncbi:MAG: J domain-containing protein, partial [Phycisphaerae bacterium]